MRPRLGGGAADLPSQAQFGACGVTGARWPGHQIQGIVTAESGASFEELAERTGLSYPEVKATVWRLYGAKRIDVCWGRYAVALPAAAAAEGGRAA